MAVPVDSSGEAYRGTPASPGRAWGPVHCARRADTTLDDPVSGDPRTVLRQAVAAAVNDLRRLASEAAPDSAGILDFQIEMLLDEEILTPAFARIAAGEGAALAWAGAMTAYINSFVPDDRDDDAFAARVADLTDLRQRVLDALAGRLRADFPAGAIYVGADMPPSVFLAHDWSAGGGIALGAGSAISHVALLARARGVPMVVGLGEITLADGDSALIDGDEGLLRLAPPEVQPVPMVAARRAAPPPGPLPTGRRFTLGVNINSLADLEAFDVAAVDGIGLVRTEFLFPTAADALNEERHVAAYVQLLARLNGRPVTVRMLDLGGDKTLAGVAEGGAASLLGLRGIRLLLAYPELARVQARALLRAAALGPLSVLLPMVTLPGEVTAMAQIFAEEEARLAARGVSVARPPLGIMVEVPAAALTLDLFGAAAFFSVGTNDLIQYLSAAARDNPAVAPLNAGSEIALFRLLDQVSASARALSKPLSVCGDLAGEPQGLARLVAAGFRDVSVAPSRLEAVHELLRGAVNADTGAGVAHGP